ncbi:MAG: dihydrolipoyl dehydrogenase [Oscillospiraceae bacterium]|nr:dihydrolipoyl dehydrogenase [Oscillospiraceae bacterium]
MNDYQLAVIGAGPGGYVAAIRAAQLGLKTVVIENRDVGGTCLNRGCIPTKTLLHAAEVYHQAKDAQELGLDIPEVGYHMGRIHDRKLKIVLQLRGGVEQLFKANKIDLVRGTATIVAPHEISIIGSDNGRITADHILVATGSLPARPPIPGLELPGVVTSDEILDGEPMDYKSLIIIGGGVIGVEFATFYNRLGCDVTIVEAMDRLLPTMDREISQNLTMILKKRGVAVYTGAMVQEISAKKSQLCCLFHKDGQEESVLAQGVLVAIGRRPNTEGLWGPDLSPEMERGRIVTAADFSTSLENIWAIGDVTSRVQLAHMASSQGIAVAETIAGQALSVDLSVVPSCIYTDPEIASVGLSADEAKERGIAVKTGKFMMAANGKTQIEGKDRGFIKVVCDEASGVVLGAQLMCARATDLVSEFADAIVNRLTSEQMRRVIRPHPTFTEAVTESLEDLEGHAIHVAPKRRPAK